MRPYVITGIATAIIIIIVSGMWLGRGIDTVDFITALAVGLILIIPCIWWWAYNKEKEARHISQLTDRDYWQTLKKLKPRKSKVIHPKFSDKSRSKEDKWRFFPANVD